MTDIPCYLLERTGVLRRFLRRYTHSENKCPRNPHGFGHDASVHLDDIEIGLVSDRPSYDAAQFRAPNWPADDYRGPGWPEVCEACGYIFQESDHWQVYTDWLWRDTRNGALIQLSNAEHGAMFHAWWREDYPAGPDGIALAVKLPGGHIWHVDGRCSNCTMPDDKTHRCWPRQGTIPNITVAKHLGPTCSAGAGSVVCDNWHGFLLNGFLTLRGP